MCEGVCTRVTYSPRDGWDLYLGRLRDARALDMAGAKNGRLCSALCAAELFGGAAGERRMRRQLGRLHDSGGHVCCVE